MPVPAGVNHGTCRRCRGSGAQGGVSSDPANRLDGMVTAATIAILLAALMLLNIEAWRRRTTAEIRADQRRRVARERAWEAVATLDREAA